MSDFIDYAVAVSDAKETILAVFPPFSHGLKDSIIMNNNTPYYVTSKSTLDKDSADANLLLDMAKQNRIPIIMVSSYYHEIPVRWPEKENNAE